MLTKIANRNEIDYSSDVSISNLALTLKNESIISLIDWRQLQTWIDIGNKAAHEEFDQVLPQQISDMINGISLLEGKYLK